MVQREVGERLAAPPGGREYGVSSVLAQLACEVRVLRAVSRTVFRPVPNVDSVLVGLRRTGPAAPAELRALVRDAFAHRRKALPRSLALSGRWGPDVVPRARAALRALGHPEDERAERLAPEEFRMLLRELAPMRLRALAPGKLNLGLRLGPTRADGRHELATVFQSVSLADELILELTDGDQDVVACPGVDGENLAAPRAGGAAAGGVGGAAGADPDRQAGAGGRGHGRRLGRCRRRAAARRGIGAGPRLAADRDRRPARR